MTEIETFIEARCVDVERYAEREYGWPTYFGHTSVSVYRQILEWHKNWPVLVEGPIKFEPKFNAQPCDLVDHYTMQMSKQIAWMTEQEYIKKFGVDPPTVPILKIIANQWKEHPEFKPEWRIE